MATETKKRAIGRRHRRDKPISQETQRKVVISSLAKTLNKARIAAHGEDLEEAKEALTHQLYRIGEGCRFYDNLGILDDETSARVGDLCLKIEKRFYDKYNASKGF